MVRHVHKSIPWRTPKQVIDRLYHRCYHLVVRSILCADVHLDIICHQRDPTSDNSSNSIPVVFPPQCHTSTCFSRRCDLRLSALIHNPLRHHLPIHLRRPHNQTSPPHSPNPPRRPRLNLRLQPLPYPNGSAHQPSYFDLCSDPLATSSPLRARPLANDFLNSTNTDYNTNTPLFQLPQPKHTPDPIPSR